MLSYAAGFVRQCVASFIASLQSLAPMFRNFISVSNCVENFVDFSQFSQCEDLGLEIVKLSDDIVREEINNHKVKEIESFPILNFLLKSFLIDVQCSHL